MDSCEAMQLLHRISMLPDIVYVDACHHYEGAYRDVNTAMSMFPRAHIIGDDWDYDDVRKAAQAMRKDWKYCPKEINVGLFRERLLKRD